MTRLRVTLTRTKVEKKVVELDVDDASAAEVLKDLKAPYAELWAKQAALLAPGDWIDTTLKTTLSPDVAADIERIE